MSSKNPAMKTALVAALAAASAVPFAAQAQSVGQPLQWEAAIYG